MAIIAEGGDHLRQEGVGVLLSGHGRRQAQHPRADCGFHVVRQSLLDEKTIWAILPLTGSIQARQEPLDEGCVCVSVSIL